MLEAPAGIEPAVKVLQTSALPLGYGATRGVAPELPLGVEPENSLTERPVRASRQGTLRVVSQVPAVSVPAPPSQVSVF